MLNTIKKLFCTMNENFQLCIVEYKTACYISVPFGIWIKLKFNAENMGFQHLTLRYCKSKTIQDTKML